MKRIFVLSVLLLGPYSLLGQGWTVQPSGTSNVLWSVFFTDENTGWAVGDNGTIRHTTNGGAIWSSQGRGYGGTQWFSVFFIDASIGWVVGSYGTILQTTDGGNRWVAQTSGTGSFLYSVFFTDASLGWVVGGPGTILHTTDGGTSWTTQASGTTRGLRSVFFTDALTGWVAGEGLTILHTTDGGTTWMSQSGGGGSSLTSIYFVDAVTGWTVGAFAIILHTTDGGTTWTQQSAGTDGFDSIFFADASTGWAVGGLGTIVYTANGGTTWRGQTSGTTKGLISVFFVDASTGWAAGNSGVILHYSDGTSGSSAVSVVARLSPDSGNGAFDYSIQLSNNTDSLQTVDIWTEVFGPLNGHKVETVIYEKTLSAGGSRWELMARQLGANAPDGEYNLYSYVGTYPNVVMDYSSSTYTKTSPEKWSTAEGKEIPDAVELSGNYPNPFNPSTTIKYGLPEKAHVRLEVFNMLGQSVAVLVDGEQEPGYHSAVFEGTGLASGVYIYRLTANTLVQTKRFLLLR